MSKGKELQYSVNRSFEKNKLSLLRDARISIGSLQRVVAYILLTSAIRSVLDYTIAMCCCNDNILTDVSGRERINVNFSVIPYRNIEQELG